MHKGRETFWSLVLVGINLLATALITSALINWSEDTPGESNWKITQISEKWRQEREDWKLDLEDWAQEREEWEKEREDWKEEGRLKWLKADEGLCDWLHQFVDIQRRKRSTYTLTKAELFDLLCGYDNSPTDSSLDSDWLEEDPFDIRTLTLRRRRRSTDALKRIFLENIDGSGVKYYKPRFLFAFGLPSLLCHLVGSILLLLQYKLVHPWRQLGREREANLWGKLGGTKRGMNEEMSHWRSTDKVIYEKLNNIENLPFVTQI